MHCTDMHGSVKECCSISGGTEGSDVVHTAASGSNAPELEKKLRENIISRGVYSFKIGSGGKSESALHKAQEDQHQSAGQCL